jgi:UDP-glucose 4-epimerase
MIAQIENTCQVPVNTIQTNKRAGDPPTLVADPSKAHDILGWKPKYSDIAFILQSAYAAQQLYMPNPPIDQISR